MVSSLCPALARGDPSLPRYLTHLPPPPLSHLLKAHTVPCLDYDHNLISEISISCITPHNSTLDLTMDLKKEKSKAETTKENIGKLYFIRMKDWYALKDAIK